MGEHIPGPWRITGPYHYAHDLHPSYRIDASHTLIASVFDHVISGEANARLIAKAPDLLAALKEAVSFENEDTECLIDQNDRDAVCPDERCKAHGCMVARVNRWRAVIAEAEGKSNV